MNLSSRLSSFMHTAASHESFLIGKYGVGRVIARPFEGEWPYTRTSRRHDFSH